MGKILPLSFDFYHLKIISKSVVRSIDLSNCKASAQRNSTRMVNLIVSVLIERKNISSRNKRVYNVESRPWFISDQEILGIRTESISDELQ